MIKQISKLSSLVFATALGISTSVSAATLTLSWQAPSDADLSSYKVHWGAGSRFIPGNTYANIVPIGNVTTYQITVPDNQTLYFAVSALDASANESAYSNEVSATTTIGGGGNGGGGNGGGGDGGGGTGGGGNGDGSADGKRLPNPIGPVRAILDFDGDAVSDVGLFADAALGLQNEIALSGAGSALNFATDHVGLKQAFADHDGDGISDISMVEKTDAGMIWSALGSMGGTAIESTFGSKGDFYLSGCHFDNDLQADYAAVKARKLVIKKSDASADVSIPFKVARKSSAMYCADMNGDGIDEVILSGKLTPKQLDLLADDRGDKEYYVAVYNLNRIKVFERFLRSMRNVVAADFNGDGFEELGLYAPGKGKIKYFLVGAVGSGSKTVQKISRATPVTLNNGSGLRANGLVVQGSDGRLFQYDLTAGSEVELGMDVQGRELITEVAFGK